MKDGFPLVDRVCFRDPMHVSRIENRPLLAFAWMFLSGLAFSVMTIFVRTLVVPFGGFEVDQIVFFRSLVTFFIFFPVCASQASSWRDLLPSRSRILFIRGLLGFLGLNCFFYVLGALPLSIATLLSWSSPLFTLFFARIFLGERAKKESIFWILLSLAGLAIVVLSPARMGEDEMKALPLFPVLIGLLGAFFGGLARVTVRMAADRFSVSLIVLYFSGVSILLSLPFLKLESKWPTHKEFYTLLGVGVAASFAQFCLTKAYRAAAAGLVGSMTMISVLFTLIWGWVLFDEVLNLYQWTGIMMMGSGIVLLALRGKVIQKVPTRIL